ncbi:MAG: hypothetical protein KF782_34375, partial [Labilithrix sp.]|nr:hypothetical protein [Labilithrix sp.]
MSLLIPFLAKLKESGAERVFFAPNERAVALEGEQRRPMSGDPVRGAAILEAVSELLSQDDISGLSSRPRIVRHEHEGEDFVLEIVRQATGVALGIRQAAKTTRALRDSVRRDDPPAASKSPVPEPRRDAGPTSSRKRPSRRPQGAAADREPPPVEDTRARARGPAEVDPGSREPVLGSRGPLPDERLETKQLRRPDGARAASEAGDGAQEVLQRARDVARETAVEAARDAAREAARDVAREAARDVAREAARDVAREVAAEATRSAGETAREVAAEAA